MNRLCFATLFSFALLSSVSACSLNTSDGEAADEGEIIDRRDPCDVDDRYDDGVCDRDCFDPDPDCDGVGTGPSGGDGDGDGSSGDGDGDGDGDGSSGDGDGDGSSGDGDGDGSSGDGDGDGSSGDGDGDGSSGDGDGDGSSGDGDGDGDGDITASDSCLVRGCGDFDDGASCQCNAGCVDFGDCCADFALAGCSAGDGDGDGDGDVSLPVPASWACNAEYFGDGECDCGCEAPDVDCLTNSIESCVYTACTAPMTIDPDDISQCIEGAPVEPVDPVDPPPAEGWTCAVEWFGDGVCDCGCGDLDSDCPANPTTASCGYDACPDVAKTLNPNDITQCL